MSGKIISEENRIHIFPPDLAAHYVVELLVTDHIRIWVVIDGQKFATDHIPLEVVPYMEILIKRRKVARRNLLEAQCAAVSN
ncbi:hypothetical protein ACFL27_06915 [candidate division CSSED10-310 bacterium]|uniref:Uncharacterized protein n=1 Tax=candidate division CSSED10-310 bacterium TaxID=2855610 RepID=A0ABV6YUQ1_UNCC1